MTPPTIQVEAWIAERLRLYDLFDGVTTPEIRRDRIRERILARGMTLAIAGRGPGGKSETWQELFARVYGTPLEVAADSPTTQRGTDRCSP